NCEDHRDIGHTLALQSRMEDRRLNRAAAIPQTVRRRRRRAKARRPPLARRVRPGKPAPAMGPGTAAASGGSMPAMPWPSRNEKFAPVIGPVSPVTGINSKLQVSNERSGLCAGLSAIEPFAFE